MKRLEPWLAEPDVALALDPEWRMGPHERPGERLGSTAAGEINEVSRWLDGLTAGHRLPQKLMIVHQFTRSMVRDKDEVAGREHLAITFNMDGLGPPGAKLAKYRMLAEDERFPLGFKLFLGQDVHRLSPREVLDLDPPPRVVEYQ